jgi:acid phosphatase
MYQQSQTIIEMPLSAKIDHTKHILITLLFPAILWTGCSSSQSVLENESTGATLWVQNASEFKALTTMVYQSAANELATAVNVKSWTAAIEQEGTSYRKLPPAVVLDVDETVLDNAPYQARLIKANKSYTTESWNAWVREEKADAIPGALAFAKEAIGKGITVLYLTNREAKVEEATYNNLKKLGFPLEEGTDVILTKNERPEWTSAKVNRRKYIATNYRIVMLIGDNLSDLLPADDISGQQRDYLVDKHAKRFGTQWFILPNPIYGSWQEALYDFDSSFSPEQIEQRKKEKLDTRIL